METLRKWIDHSGMSDPVGYAAAMAGLPSDVGALNGIIQGVLVHSDWLTDYGLDESLLSATSRTTLPIADRLADILERDGQGLETRRPSSKRALGTCRDFALMLCSILRSQGVPARLRCGFAAYFGSGWEDHWVCEYWDSRAQTWRLSDPQIDEMLKARYRIGFDPTDVPRQSFLTAGQAWLDGRRGKSDPDRFGHGEVTGAWFVKVNVVRDHYVLNDRETSIWDGWRAALPSKRVVNPEEFALLDDLAADPEQPLVEVVPDWLA
ncbi:transglutaminase-like domain-containing protein [Hypericibacter sp.]|uniref:transglutaminase-like domain-containing protein n=1 Tax=Hypericibacter sp. TaxID=2705401 RepID=UPI003D6CADF9